MNSTTRSPELTLSVCIITLNEAENLPRCLASVAGLADETVVVDSLSTDRTPEIAATAGARVWQQSFAGYVRQKQFALDKASCDWVLCLDADEWLDDDLRGEVRRVLNSTQCTGVCGYELNRRNFYLGKWIRFSGWSPQWRVRLARREAARWTGIDPHDRLEVSGSAGRLKGRLNHIPYKSVNGHLRKLNHYSSILADHQIRKGCRPSVFGLLFEPPLRFLQMFVLRAGFRDGLRGFVLASMHALNAFLRHAKRWEAELAADCDTKKLYRSDLES